MYKIPFPDLKEKILASNKITPRELEQKIKDKINELSGLISEEGAAHILANELGIQVYNSLQDKMKIKELYAGMRNISTAGKILRKFEMREFQKEDRTGKVASLLMGDETGTVRVVFWNNQVEEWEKLKDEETLLIRDAVVRENKLGNKELHLNERSQLTVNPEGLDITSIRKSTPYERTTITALQDGQEGVEIMGTIVQIFDPRFFYSCSNCGKRLNEVESVYHCAEHGAVQPKLGYVLNLILDDGTNTIRGVFWKNQTNHLLGKTEEQLLQYRENIGAFEDVKTELLGEQLKVMGKTRRNELFDRLELNVQFVERANPQEELARLERVSPEQALARMEKGQVV